MKIIQKISFNTLVIIAYAVLSCCIFAFFMFGYCYHLFHREQVSLFLLNAEFIRHYFSGQACLANLIGDFLTQFYYYIAAGPVIIASVLWLLAIVVRKVALHVGLLPKVAAVLGAIAMLWEMMRELYFIYPLSSSIALLISFGLVLLYPTHQKTIVRIVCAIAIVMLSMLVAGNAAWLTLFSIVISEIYCRNVIVLIVSLVLCLFLPRETSKYTQWISLPNFYLERQFAADVNYSWHTYKSVAKPDLLPVEQYYNILSNITNLDAIVKPSVLRQTSMLPIDQTSNYFYITAAGELWFEMGDMTMAEHATMLGMIFSPYHHGTRYLRRLAEINIIVGDENAAEKYLRMLSQTIVHKKWAQKRLKNNRTDDYKAYLTHMQTLMPTADSIRYTTDYKRSMRNMLNTNRNNVLARNYLFLTELKNKDVVSFATDIEQYLPPMQLDATLAEAYIVAMAAVDSVEREKFSVRRVSPEIMQRFAEFNKLYLQYDSVTLCKKYSDSYWFYYKFQSIK